MMKMTNIILMMIHRIRIEENSAISLQVIDAFEAAQQ